MLGNFSFGDYFKREAIHWAWEFLTDKKWLGIPADRLTVTVYLDDDEALGIWHDEIELPPTGSSGWARTTTSGRPARRARGPTACAARAARSSITADGGEAVEIWNLVFTQFNRVGDPPNNLRPLPSKNIDTGMGLERMAAVLQGGRNEFSHRHLAADRRGGGRSVRREVRSEERSTAAGCGGSPTTCGRARFAVHENVYPGPNKERYVIKRLLRRAVLDGHQMGIREPFLHKLVPNGGRDDAAGRIPN